RKGRERAQRLGGWKTAGRVSVRAGSSAAARRRASGASRGMPVTRAGSGATGTKEAGKLSGVEAVMPQDGAWRPMAQSFMPGIEGIGAALAHRGGPQQHKGRPPVLTIQLRRGRPSNRAIRMARRECTDSVDARRGHASTKSFYPQGDRGGQRIALARY